MAVDQVGLWSTWPRIVWRMLGGYMQLFPAVSTNEYLGIEYMSSLLGA